MQFPCRRCGVPQPIEAFPRDPDCTCGRRRTCKLCREPHWKASRDRYRRSPRGRAAVRRHTRAEVASGRSAAAQHRYYLRLREMVLQLLNDGGPKATAAATPRAMRLASDHVRSLARRA